MASHNIIAVLVCLLLTVHCKLECYGCHEDTNMHPVYITANCDNKKECDSSYCVSLTYKWNELSYQVRGCAKSDTDYPCSALYSECKRDTCIQNLCNSSHRLTATFISLVVSLFLLL